MPVLSAWRAEYEAKKKEVEGGQNAWQN